MNAVRRSRWFYAVAGSGVVLGIFGYFQSQKRIVHSARTNNFVPSVKWDSNWDNRDYVVSSADENDPNLQNKLNEQKLKETPKARRHIFLIRHGQYEMKPRLDADRHLTKIGEQQADLVGQRLKDMNFNFSRMVRSTMTRAMETSDIILKYFPNIPVENCDLLREGAPAEPDPPHPTWKIPNEVITKDNQRIEAAFHKHFHRADPSQESDSYELMVCHANVIRYFVCRLLQFPPQAWLRLGMHHCAITWVVITPSGRVVLYALGDSGFLPRNLLTTS